MAALLRGQRALLAEAGADTAHLSEALTPRIEALPAVAGPHSPLASRRPAPRIDAVVQQARELAGLGGYDAISVAHVLLALLVEGASDTGRLLAASGTDARLVQDLARREPPSGDGPAGLTEGFAAFGEDMVELARRGLLDPVVGREAEVARVLQLLNRRTKNNPVLIGEPGVGKTAIVEGIAQRIASGDVPPAFRETRIFSLNVAALLANSGNRGEFEGRLQSLLTRLRRARRSIILFVDEAHLLVGAGAAEGGLDAASILKPALARGEFAFIGATTPDAYRRFIEPDAALERRLAPVWVAEPTREDCLRILDGVRPLLEAHHGVAIDADALAAAVDFSARYIAARRLPDKAIDLVDEASSAVSLAGTVPAARPWGVPRVSVDDIAAVVAGTTGVPVGRMLQPESERLRDLGPRLARQVFGQDAAVATVASVVQRSRLGLGDPSRPIASLLFAGPPGVGKTELALGLAEALFGDRRALLRLDMSEFAERHAVARLVGAPPGYVGYDDATALTETVRRRPYQVVLFDEIDRAHEDARNILLQVMDAGRLTDGQGRTVSFRNCVLVFTVTELAAGRSRVKELAPEFRNRLDATVEFEPLGPASLRAIAQHRVAALKAALAEQGLTLTVSPAVVAQIQSTAALDAGGARAILRAFDDLVVAPLTRHLLAQRPAPGSAVAIGVRQGRISCTTRVGAAAAAPSVPPALPVPAAARERRAFERDPVGHRQPLSGPARGDAVALAGAHLI